jgi:transposase
MSTFELLNDKGDVVASAIMPKLSTYQIAKSSKYKPEFCEKVVELGEQGLTRAQIAKQLGVGRATLLDWADRHEDFKFAMELSDDMAMAKWEEEGMRGMNDKMFQGKLYMDMMRFRFPKDYMEKKSIEVTGNKDQPISVDMSSALAAAVSAIKGMKK